MALTKQEIKEAAEHDLFTFAKIVNPTYLYGEIHEKVFRWLSSPDASKRQLLLLPRGHLKSHCIATWALWMITKKPWTTMLYLSASEDLAKDQLYAIKNMMLSDTYKRLWPDIMSETEREQMSAYSFNVTHPERKRRGVRDHTIIVKTVKANFVGLHADYIVFDDVVVPKNAYSEVGRAEVRRALSQCTSILNANGSIKAVGTVYHPADAYNDMMVAKRRVWDEAEKAFISEEPLWSVMREEVEDEGDGTGKFLWPREQSPATNEWYGFDPQTLEDIRIDYFSRGEQAQYYAQYYNNANAVGEEAMTRDCFQYYDEKFLTYSNGVVTFKGNRLNVYAAMDVAWTDISESGGASADYTAIVVVGVSSDGLYYILDIDRFKTATFSVYYNVIKSLADKWGFRSVKIETNAGGKIVANEITRLSREEGSPIFVEEASNTGVKAKSKALRQLAIINPKYETRSIFHKRGGLTSELEEEIMLERPPHDDMVDALGLALMDAKPPRKIFNQDNEQYNKVVYHPRFGGRLKG